MNYNNLILQYAKANLELDGAYHMSLPPGSKAVAQNTMNGVCGLVFPIGGKAKFTVSKQDYELKVGTILHAGSNMDLNKEVIGEDNWEFILLHYKVLQQDNQIESLLNLNYCVQIFSDQNMEIRKLLESILSLQREYGSKYVLKTKILLYELISKILAFSQTRQNPEPREQISEILEYIHTHLEKNLSIAQIAEYFQLNAKQFHYYFQKKMGISPKKYIIDTQMKRAKELLLESNLTIVEISNQVGYEDALHFSRIFKQNTGTSPSIFRKQFEKYPC